MGFIEAEDIDFGNPNTCVLDDSAVCQADMRIDCQGELSGFILSPNFPLNMEEEHSGKVEKTRRMFRVIR